MHLLVIRLHLNQLNFLFVAPKPQDIIKSAPFRWRDVCLPLIPVLELSYKSLFL